MHKQAIKAGSDTKKILFLTHWYPTKDDPLDGNYIKEHARAAALYNNEIVVIQILGCYRSIKTFYEFSDEKEGGFRVIRVKYKQSPIPKTSYFNYLLAGIATFRWLVKKGGFKPDAIHAHVFSVGILAVILGKMYRMPVIISEHYAGFLENKLNKSEKAEVRFALNRADMILPVSDALRNAISRYGVKNRFQVVANTVNMSEINIPNHINQSAEDKKRILFMGSLISRKGLPYLLEALGRIIKERNDFYLDIVGDGPERTKYERLVLDFGLKNIVRFHGVVTDSARNEFLRRCTFLVLPTLWESFGVVVIEAMAWGKPVIGTTCDAVKELVSEKTGILVAPKDTQALAGAIEYMLDRHKEYPLQEIRRSAYERFSYEAIGNKLDTIYNNLMNEKLTR